MKRVTIIFVCLILSLCLVGCNKNENKKILKLNHNVNIVELEPSTIIQEKQENLFIDNLPEVKRKMFENESYLEPIVKYIKKTFDIDVDNRWECVVHYYNEEKTDGMIQFTYFIGSEIRTNKSITMGYENGYIKDVYYKLLEKETDEADLIERVKKFKDKYTQEQISLKEGETFYGEDANYSYYYNVYSYNYKLCFYPNPSYSY